MIFFKSRCYNGGAQHRFQARVTTPPVKAPESNQLFDAAAFFADSRDKAAVITACLGGGQVYHGDVCIWCGKVVNTPPTKA